MSDALGLLAALIMFEFVALTGAPLSCSGQSEISGGAGSNTAESGSGGHGSGGSPASDAVKATAGTSAASGATGGSWPDVPNTGGTHGTELTNCSGSRTITTDGTVVDGKIVDCDLVIRASNVLIKNCKVNGLVVLDVEP